MSTGLSGRTENKTSRKVLLGSIQTILPSLLLCIWKCINTLVYQHISKYVHRPMNFKGLLQECLRFLVQVIIFRILSVLIHIMILRQNDTKYVNMQVIES